MEDISQYYTKERAEFEESEWASVKFYERNYEQIEKFTTYILEENPSRTLDILELGCGSGWIPTLLPGYFKYTGVDKNPHFLDLARLKNRSDRTFIEADVRLFSPEKIFDLSYSYAFVKHFSLEEVSVIISKILSLGKYSAIELNITPEEFDDGKDYHHTFITEEHALYIIESNSHKVLYREHTFNGPTEEGRLFDVYTFFTKRTL